MPNMKNLLLSKILIVVLFFFISNTYAQDIFSLKNSKKYANYLYKANNFTLAAEEYERILFLDSFNKSDIKLKLIRSYRFSENYNTGIARIESMYFSLDSLSNEMAYEYSKLLILNNNLPKAKFFLVSNTSLIKEKKLFFDLTTAMYENDYASANEMLKEAGDIDYAPIKQYNTILQDALSLKYKSPGLSLAMSAIAPGLGKVYCGYWKDGLVSLFMTGMSVYQAYRGFDQNGNKSAYAWIYTGMSAGFYIGNLYGSYKAANKYNFNKKHQIYHSVEEVFNTTY